MIQVKGYASSVGSASLNQKLSDDRANNVTNILIQQAHIPVGSSRVDLQACKLEYSIVSPK